MTEQELDQLAHSARVRNHKIVCCVAYAIAALEKDETPHFRLATPLTMGLSDKEVEDPVVIDILRHEYFSWIVGHGLADLLESIATFLNELADGAASQIGITKNLREFQRLGLDAKIQAAKNLSITEDYLKSIESLTRARNCLIHRQGVVASPDCNTPTGLKISWRGVGFYTDKQGEFVPIDRNHRGGFNREGHGRIKIQTEVLTRNYSLGERLVLSPSELSTISWCFGGITGEIHKCINDILGFDPISQNEINDQTQHQKI